MAKPVTILTGFLGSGKTTFLNAVLSARPETRFAIIENEFGEEGIDGDLIVHQEDNIVEMSNGCICCSLNDGLYDTLEMLLNRRESFDELIIETTGIADPAGVAVPFLTNPKAFPLMRVVCLVDAGLIEDQLRDTEEAIKQLSFSDLILLNKIDTVTDAYAEALVSTLRNINPLATILTGYKDEFPITALFALERDVELLPPAQPRTEEFYAPPVPRHHHHVHSDIVSLSFRFTEPFSMVELYHRLMTFLLFQSQGVYRIKGIVHEAGKDHRYVIQSVGKTLATTEGFDWLPGEERISRFVIIGKLLKPQGFEKMLRQCFAKDPNGTTVRSSHLSTTPNLAP